MHIKKQPLTKELKEQVDKGFSKHSIDLIGHDGLFEPIAFVASTDNEPMAGMIGVQLFWGALHIKYLFIDEAYRGKGLGTLLMKEALSYGNENNCPFAYVETLSFQALGFYQKMGFTLEFTRSGFKHGTSFHYLRKDLQSS